MDATLRLSADSGVEVEGNAYDNSVAFRLTDEALQALEDGKAALQASLANETDIAGIDVRITQLENSLAQGITTNPFDIKFDTLSGILVTNGIWNTSLRRLEC